MKRSELPEAAIRVSRPEEQLVLAKVWNFRDGERSTVDARKKVRWISDRWRVVDARGRPGKTRFAPSHCETLPVPIAGIDEAFDAMTANTGGLHQSVVIAYGVPTLVEAADDAVQLVARTAFTDASRHLHHIDIDGVAVPGPLATENGYSTRVQASDPLQRIGEWLRSEVLPPEFDDVRLILQATGSHGCLHEKSGRTDVVRLRISFWCSEPVTKRRFKRYVLQRLTPYVESRAAGGACEIVEGEKAVDPSIYDSARCLFLQPPSVLSPGNPYPHDRLALLEGDGDEVELEMPPEPAEPTAPSVRPGQRDIVLSTDLDGLLGWIGETSHKESLAVGNFVAERAWLSGRSRRAAEADAWAVEPRLRNRLEATARDEAHRSNRVETEAGQAFVRQSLTWFDKLECGDVYPSFHKRGAPWFRVLGRAEMPVEPDEAEVEHPRASWLSALREMTAQNV